MRSCGTWRSDFGAPQNPSATWKRGVRDLEPVTSSVTVDSHYHPDPPSGVQTVASPQADASLNRAVGCAGRPKTARRVPLMSPSLLTVREVATRLAVHPSTVYGLCDRGDLEHARVSNAIRIRADAVEAFLGSRSRVR